MASSRRALGLVSVIVLHLAACGGGSDDGLQGAGGTAGAAGGGGGAGVSGGSGGGAGAGTGGAGGAATGGTGGAATGGTGGAATGGTGGAATGGTAGAATGGTAGAATGGTAGAATGGSGGAAGASGAGGSGTGGATGAPITAPVDQWTWVDFPGARCRNGSATGIGIRRSATSDKVMIFLEGGGACFNALTCNLNPSQWGASDFPGWASGGGTRGIFDRNNTANPVRDWNHVYVPYCTGDVHAGDNPGGLATGLAQPQQFVGYANMALYLDRLVPTFANASQVLLTGVSAGGFGSAANFPQVQRFFGSVPVTLLDDSGPPMSSAYVATCMQRMMRVSWGLDDTILADCGATCDQPDDYLADFARHLGSYSARRLGLISSTGDNTITFFYGQGLNNCSSFLPMSATQFTAGLNDLRSTIWGSATNVGTYYISSTTHTWIGGGGFYSTTVDGTRLTDWVAALINGQVSHVGP